MGFIMGFKSMGFKSDQSLRTCCMDADSMPKSPAVRTALFMFAVFNCSVFLGGGIWHCRNSLCRSKQYCKNVAPIRQELHAQLETLVQRACKQSDSSVALYCFRWVPRGDGVGACPPACLPVGFSTVDFTALKSLKQVPSPPGFRESQLLA